MGGYELGEISDDVTFTADGLSHSDSASYENESFSNSLSALSMILKFNIPFVNNENGIKY